MTTDLTRHIEAIATFALGNANPAHSTRSQRRYGTNGSVAVEIAGPKAGTWYDHEAKEGGGPWDLLRRKLADKDIPDWLARNLGVHLERAAGGHIVAAYPYYDESGRLLFEVCRLAPKRFLQRRPSGEWGIQGVRRVLYRLPELIAAPKHAFVYIPEGEKDCDRLATLWGLVATCNPMGAGKWRSEYAAFLRGRHCVIIADNDEAGRQHVVEVATSLAPVAASVRVLHLQNLPEKGDISDWIVAGGSQSDLEALVEDTAPFETRPPVDDDTEIEGVELINGATVTPIPIPWIWNGYLARGKLHLLAGAKGAGKTTIAVSLAATYTNGGDLPDGTRAPLGDVLMWSGEDDFDDSILPRLIACGGDPGRFHFIGGITQKGKQRAFDPSTDMPALAAVAHWLPELVLIILDPIVSAIAGDSHKNAEVRRGLQPFRDLLQVTRAAGLGISHFSKGTAGQDPVDRISGSLAFGALPRAIFAAAKPRDRNTGKRRFVRVASNIGPDGGGFEYDVEQVLLPGLPFTAQRIVWGAELAGDAQELLSEVEAGDEAPAKVDQAGGWLRARLKVGPVEVNELEVDAQAAGFAWSTVRRAKRANRIVAQKDGKNGPWRWRLSRQNNQ
jgi:hypothetical protein